ncbi:hypothetical protein BAE44_0022568, partial [Dichanthelium oligosanthes]
MPRKPKTRNRKGSVAKRGEYRIGDLPDDAMRHVLSFLPADEAVRTCLLSRRWREVWKSTPVLRFTKAESWGSAAGFNKFVNHLLFFRDLAPLGEFGFKTYRFWPQISSNAFSDKVEPEIQDEYEVEMEESCSLFKKFVLSENLKIVEVRCRKILTNIQKFVEILTTCGITTNLINIREID